MFSNNRYSLIAYVLGWMLLILAFLLGAGGLFLIVTSPFIRHSGLFSLGLVLVSWGIGFFFTAIFWLMAQQILEYLIAVEQHLRVQRRKEERLEWEERQRDASL